MLNLVAYRYLPQNHYCYRKLLLQLFLHQYTQTGLPILTFLQLPTYALPISSLLSEPHQKLFLNRQSYKIRLFKALIFSCICLTIKMDGVSGSFTFHKSKLHIMYINLLPNSVFKDTFHHFHSMLQQFNSSVSSTFHWIPFPFVNCDT